MKKNDQFRFKFRKLRLAIAIIMLCVFSVHAQRPTHGREVRDNENFMIGPNLNLTYNDQSTVEPYMSFIVDDNNNESPGGFSWWADGTGGIDFNYLNSTNSPRASDMPIVSDLLMFLDQGRRELLIRGGGIKTQGKGLMDLGSLKLIANYDNAGTNEDIIFGFKGNFNNYTEQMRLTDNGYLGIGTASPEVRLHVKGILMVERNEVKVVIHSAKNGTQGWIGTVSNNGLYLGTHNNANNCYLDTANNVYIGGIIDTDVKQELKDNYDLFVKNGILAEDLAIAAKNNWADYVFDKGYELKSIEELEHFIKENKHLPNIPSQSEVSEKGYATHDLNVRFLEKIEELTLYTIQQQKTINELTRKIENLQVLITDKNSFNSK